MVAKKTTWKLKELQDEQFMMQKDQTNLKDLEMC